jgi:hypothetical protein
MDPGRSRTSPNSAWPVHQPWMYTCLVMLTNADAIILETLWKMFVSEYFVTAEEMAVPSDTDAFHNEVPVF